MKKKVAVLIPTMKEGGAERIASNLSLNFPDEWEKYLILFENTSIDYPINGIVINLDTKASKKDPFYKKIKNVLKRIIKLRRLKRELKIDVTISLLDGGNLVNIFSRTQDKIILSVHSYKSKRIKTFYDKIHKLVIQYFYNKADSIVAVSQMVKEDLIDKFQVPKEKIEVIYNGFESEKIKYLSQENLSDNEQNVFRYPVIITMGRFIPEKGQWHLIRAFNEVKKEISDAKLVLLGNGELENYLRQIINDYNLNQDVYFLGFQKNPFKYISRSTLFVFPSLVEGFGNVLIESMACSIPIISSDCKAGPREILAPETDKAYSTKEIEYANYGVLVPVCDENFYSAKEPLTKEEKDMSEAIIFMLKNEKLRQNYISRSKERVKDFEIDKNISKWVELVEREV